MGKDVVVIASGETERRVLPHLVAYLQAEGITLAPLGASRLNFPGPRRDVCITVHLVSSPLTFRSSAGTFPRRGNSV